MKWHRKLVSKKDIVIRKGTVFENIDGTNTHYASGNYEAIIGLDKDACVTIVVDNESKKYFEEVIETEVSNCEYAEPEGCFGPENCRYAEAGGCTY